MFAYVSALAPNNFFSRAKSVLGFGGIVCLRLVLVRSLYFLGDGYLVDLGNFNITKDIEMSGKIIISGRRMCLVIVLGSVLLVNLLAVVKVCYYQQGPLRFYSELK